MKELSARERVLTTLNHEEPDRVPFDFSGSHVSGITIGAYRKLRKFLGLPEDQPQWLDTVQQVVIPSDDILEKLEADTAGLFPLTAHNWNVMEKLEDGGENWIYRDEWGCTHEFPKERGHWFSMTGFPMSDGMLEMERIEAHPWPNPADPARFVGLRERAEKLRSQEKAVLIKGLCAGLFEMSQRLRGMENALMDPAMTPDEADRLYGKLADLKIAYWEGALDEVGDLVDIVVESDDYGTQESQLISVDQFRGSLKSHWSRVIRAIKERAPHVKFFFHSCGNVRPFLPDFIEIGVDILNPVHITAKGMNPVELKRDFGREMVFWGGGVETQSVLPTGTPEQVREDVRRNVDALMPGGGFVFNTVHNIQSETPPENILAMWEALREFGVY